MILIGCISPVAFAAENSAAAATRPQHVHAPSHTSASFADRSTVRAFVASMHQKHGIDQKKLLALLADCHSNPKILSLMDKQFEAKPWYTYRARVITPTRIQEGALFWKKNASALKTIQKIYGIPPEIIVSIIGLETSYGQNTGSFKLLESLSTLAFDYPRRSAFFKKELEQLLLLAQEGAVDLATAKGSYAGAMGMPQFMPSSYRQYAVDFSGKGQRDLLHNTEDVLGSVAYYLQKHGWQSGKGIVRPLRKFEKSPRSAGDSKKNKIKTIILKDSPDTEKYYAGLPNFSVIMRYNNSTHYAMAIVLLSEQIRKAYKYPKALSHKGRK